MGFFCKECSADIEAPYEWTGAPVSCPSCALVVPLQHKSGHPVATSNSGDGISFEQYVGLMNTRGWRENAHPLIARLLNCSVEQHNGSFSLRAKNGALIPSLFAHLKIQADPDCRRQIYNLAMSMWR
jgi:hypothetical protein